MSRSEARGCHESGRAARPGPRLLAAVVPLSVTVAFGAERQGSVRQTGQRMKAYWIALLAVTTGCSSSHALGTDAGGAIDATYGAADRPAPDSMASGGAGPADVSTAGDAPSAVDGGQDGTVSGIDAGDTEASTDGAWPGADLGRGRWANLTPAVLPTAWPPASQLPGVAYDVDRGRLVVFGGLVINSLSLHPLGDVWERSTVSGLWENRTPDPLPTSWPGARSQHSFVYDVLRKRSVLVGGVTTVGLVEGDTWEWDGGAGSWSLRSATSSSTLGARMGAAVAYDTGRSTVILFGGLGVIGNDVWEWSGANSQWVGRTPAVLPTEWPSKRSSMALVFDDSRQRAVLFSGIVLKLAPPLLKATSADTWEWDGVSWALGPRKWWAEPIHLPRWKDTSHRYPLWSTIRAAPGCGGSGQYDPRKHVDCVGREPATSGGSDAGIGTPKTDSVTGASAAYDPVSQRVLVFGASMSGGNSNEQLWS